MKKITLRLALFLVTLLALCTPADATNEETDVTKEAETAYATFLESVPDEVKEFLPADFFENSLDGSEASLREAGSVQNILRVIGRILGLSLGEI